MSVSKKRLLKSALLGILSVSLLGTAISCFPENPRGPVTLAPLAFALGSNDQVPEGYQTVYMKVPGLIATFANGSVTPLFDPSGLDLPSVSLIPDQHAGEFDATDLTALMVDIYQILKIDGGSFGEPSKILLQCIPDMTVNATLSDDKTDLGSSRASHEERVTSLTDTSIPHGQSDFDELPLGFPSGIKKQTGFWNGSNSWVISTSQLAEILDDSPNPACITFSMNYEMYVAYKITVYGRNSTGGIDIRNQKSVTGYAHLQWSGIAGTLQFIHSDGQTLAVRYNFSSIKLYMKETAPFLKQTA